MHLDGDRGAWWAIVCRIAESRTQLKQLSMHARKKTPHSKGIILTRLKTSSLTDTWQRKELRERGELLVNWQLQNCEILIKNHYKHLAIIQRSKNGFVYENKGIKTVTSIMFLDHNRAMRKSQGGGLPKLVIRNTGDSKNKHSLQFSKIQQIHAMTQESAF